MSCKVSPARFNTAGFSSIVTELNLGSFKLKINWIKKHVKILSVEQVSPIAQMLALAHIFGKL